MKKNKGHRMMKWVTACVPIMLLAAVVTVYGGQSSSSSKNIRIGIIGPMKFTLGHAAWNGANLAAEEINAVDGIQVGGLKRKIKLIKADSNGIRSVTDSVKAMEKLLTVDKAEFVIGGFKSEATLAMQDVAMDYKKIFLGTGASDHQLNLRVAKDYGRYKYWFRVTPVCSGDLGKQGFALVEMVANEIRKKTGIMKPRVALLMDKGIWTVPIVKASQAFLPKLGLEIAGLWQPAMGATNYSAELAAIKASGAQITFVMNSGPGVGALAKQWGETQIPTALVGVITESLDRRFWKATNGMCEYILQPSITSRVKLTTRTIPFFDKYMDRFDRYPDYNAATYDALYILKEAIERGGTLDRDALVVELEKTDYEGSFGRYVFSSRDFERPHDAVWGPKNIALLGVQWQKGKVVPVWPNGKPALGDTKWAGVKFEGTVDYELPPWVVEYWKGKEAN